MTTAGRIQGEQAGGVARFLRVPYAAAPVGALRFAGPVAAQVWDGVRDATRPGPTAPQPPYQPVPGLDLIDLAGEGWRHGEEYLIANIWSPDPGASGLPVMVFIHGGGYATGAGLVPACDGASFARNGVVLVSINYRLGIEGFLQLKGGATNVGLRDQIAALEWVHDNAAAFGGDPDNVTLFGESAGAASIGCLLASPPATGLFKRAILCSGHPEMVRPPSQAQALADALAAALGVPATAEAFRDKTSEELIAVHGAGYGVDLRDEHGVEPFGGILPYTPVTGDDVLPEHPAVAIKNGAGSDVALIVGTNREEFNLTTVPNGAIDTIDDNQAVASLSAIRPNAAETLVRFGLGAPGITGGQALTTAQTDLTFRLPARRLAAAHRGRTHFYELAWRSPALGGRLGACHSLIVPFMFNTLPIVTGPDRMAGPNPPQELADHIHQAWIRFATTGDVGWPVYGTDRRLLWLDTPTDIRPDDVPSALAERFDPTSSSETRR
ncbi:carboxylesterase family protein [Streptomyces sp. ZAF1911]|uniref:carboxylesterase/lipase family protein n=1 Tax=Streptomyces sp. ZAF1911 TaxID=2944129 RepID=UPI00237BE1A9|nr:carboxylesterase family protein [Streptomyces sp. ZAF1911]MDD9375831.1 carboxylesterase family protein [Streptomyces sp. ZAF1911]